MKTIEERFWEKVNILGENDCWEWKGNCNRDGYGISSLDGKNQGSHRISFILNIGKIPNGLCVLHICDNPPCCNPKHLFLGTRGDNARDMIKKGRGIQPDNRGSGNGNSKLTEIDVINIRRMWVSGKYKQSELAEMFKVNRSHISIIARGKQWKHIPVARAT